MITVCFIENIDPLGVHTGDSFCCAPMLTISEDCQRRLQEQAYKIVDKVQVIGGTNVQFAHDPVTDRIIVIEINPRTSRSSALASKATGFPIALVSAMLAAGLTLRDIPCGKYGTLDKYVPDGDYVVIKFARWAFEKFKGVEDKLGTQMRAVGEVMSIGNSFEAAMMELGGNVLGFSSASSSSSTKGESVGDTVKIVSCYADIIAMRHYKEGAPMLASMKSDVPIINAGDGGHNHPTQTLADLLTIKREKGRLNNMTIGFCGDLMFGRTVHSLIKAMSRYEGIKFILISPDELKLPDYIRTEVIEKNNIPYEEISSLEDAIGSLDVLYMTRVQKERFFNEADYIRLKDTYILDKSKLALARPDLSILHPLPRVNEISVEVDDDPRACYFRQALNGKYVRMALIMDLLGLDKDFKA